MQKQPTVGPEWQSTSAKGASLAGFGLPMNHKTEFRDSDARFESSGTQAKLRDKFGDLGCNLLFILSCLVCIPIFFCSITSDSTSTLPLRGYESRWGGASGRVERTK